MASSQMVDRDQLKRFDKLAEAREEAEATGLLPYVFLFQGEIAGVINAVGTVRFADRIEHTSLDTMRVWFA